jgi:cold-inducible RNA-binding protein
MKIYVGNLSFSSTKETIEGAFAAFGTVEDVHIITDRETGRPRGFGFVTMSSESEARAAIEGMNGQELDGRVLNVNEARPKRENDRRER